MATPQRQKVEQILRHFCAAGLTLETCADTRHMGRAMSTLKRYARRLDLKFPDYCPRHLRRKKRRK